MTGSSALATAAEKWATSAETARSQSQNRKNGRKATREQERAGIKLEMEEKVEPGLRKI